MLDKMMFKELEIINYRNFKEEKIDLSNKNIIFGINDVGKTNLLFALRVLLDDKIRRQGIKETDFYQRNLEEDIEIILTIHIPTDEEAFRKDDNLKNLISKTKSVLNLSQSTELLLKLKGSYDKEDMSTNIEIFWGVDKSNMVEMARKGLYYEIDKIFNVVYIDATIDLDKIFEKNKKIIFNESKGIEADKEIIGNIENFYKNINDNVSKLSLIKEFEDNISKEYKEYKDEDINIKVKSEAATKGVFNDLNTYISKDNNYYPTSGDGRKKILAYAILNLINSKNKGNKIDIFLIEEPENHLHKNMQVSLSKKLFSEQKFDFVFLTTHSPYIIHEVDSANLIRLSIKDSLIDSKSYMYNVPENFNNYKKVLNKSISEAIFMEKVLLVEGPSEYYLFTKILEAVSPGYEINGIDILEILGIGFGTYVDVLESLGITVFIRTDNDIKSVTIDGKKYITPAGINRCLALRGKEKLEHIGPFTEEESDKIIKNKSNRIEYMKELYKNEKVCIDEFSDCCIEISEVDLEHDLYSVIPEKIDLWSKQNGSNAIVKLQKKKKIHMLQLIKLLSEEDLKKIYNSEKFKCLKEILK